MKVTGSVTVLFEVEVPDGLSSKEISDIVMKNVKNEVNINKEDVKIRTDKEYSNWNMGW